jgi:two-component system KDP operon response regulator KdpE
MAEETILIVDDDPTLLDLFGEHLVAGGYRTLRAESGEQALALAASGDPNLVVLDVMMPGMDGWEVCRRLRRSTDVPIILLTAKNEELDKLRGFRLGVDDYVTKPFTARIGAVLARAQRTMPRQGVRSGDLEIDLVQRRVTVSGSIVELTPTEYRLLEVLAQHPRRPLPTEMLLQKVWGPTYAGETEHVKHYIWSLRKKIESDPGDPRHILTERGYGYRLE